MQEIRKAYKLAAEARPDRCTIIPVAEYSWEHGVGSEEPWVDGGSVDDVLAGRVTYHPNARGMKAVADLIFENLKKKNILKSRL